jgi:hypothetical protein
MGYMKITPRGLKFRNIMDWHLPRIWIRGVWMVNQMASALIGLYTR